MESNLTEAINEGITKRVITPSTSEEFPNDGDEVEVFYRGTLKLTTANSIVQKMATPSNSN